MTLFSKIFGAVFASFLGAAAVLSYVISSDRADEVVKQIAAEHQLISRLVSRKLTASFFDQRWPFEDLRRIADREDFRFWWIVTGDGVIHLSDRAEFMGTHAAQYFPRLTGEIPDEEVILDHTQNYGILRTPLETGPNGWSFWLGFSLNRARTAKFRVALTTIGLFGATLLVLAVVLYFLLERILRPIQTLRAGVENVSAGSLTHRIHVGVRDELGDLAQSFNRMTEQLQKTTVSREYLDSILESMTDALIVLDSQLRIRTVNGSTCELLGYKAEELAGQGFSLIICDPEGSMDLLGLRPDESFRNREGSFRKKSGIRVPVLLSGSCLRGEGQSSIGYVVTGRDSTELKRIQAELANARDAAVVSSRMKSEFVANMSHEIRTPMNGIIGMTELLFSSRLAPEQQQYLRMIQDSARSLMTLLNDILDFSKIEAGKLDLIAKPFHLRDWLDDLLRPLAFNAHQKGLELAAIVAPEVPPVLTADPDRLRQVLVNLVGNAIKFTADGEVVVEVRLQQEVPARRSCILHFAVRDTGIGIPAEKREIIFESFTQADGSTSRKYGGTGLGLTISSRLVSMMGGRLEITSEVGKGSVFYFDLETPLPVEGVENSETLPGEFALILDSSPVAAKSTGCTLASLGIRFESADSVPAALESGLVRPGSGISPTLILADHRFHDDIGRLRTALADTSILIGMQQVGDPEGRAPVDGFDALILKPVSRSELRSTVNRFRNRAVPVKPASAPVGLEELSGLSILLAEDNHVNQLLAKRLLEKCGHTVTVTGNGRQAVRMFERGRFDLVLMDVQMPELNGLEATAMIRAREAANPNRRRTPIVAVTAHALKGDRERFLEAGMDAYVSKPLNSAELFQTIATLVNGATPGAVTGDDRELQEYSC
ncbi:MAG: ATP-binding protein [Bryobacteraceae bacterium]